MINLDGVTYLTHNETADRLGLARAVLRNYRSEGKDGIASTRFLGRVLYRETDVDAYLALNGRRSA